MKNFSYLEISEIKIISTKKDANKLDITIYQVICFKTGANKIHGLLNEIHVLYFNINYTAKLKINKTYLYLLQIKNNLCVA